MNANASTDATMSRHLSGEPMARANNTTQITQTTGGWLMLRVRREKP